MDTNPTVEVAPPASLELNHEPNDVPAHIYPANQDVSETTESTVLEPTHNAGFSAEEPAQQTTYPAEVISAPQNYFPAEDEQNSSRFSSPTMSNQQTPQQSASRPGSGLSSGGERYGYANSQPEQNQKQAAPASKNSVVIKVGMVGDAQIGKTSLMVKYVEGSWDEDYIQTLGK
jgi:Gtp-binding protein of the ras superfamily involved in termination of M-phase